MAVTIYCFGPMMLGKEQETACFLIYIETAVSNLMLEDSVIGRFLNGLRLHGAGRALRNY
ncbi:MAG: hypothetical protein ACLR6B_14460 [Blautia sp.]